MYKYILCLLFLVSCSTYPEKTADTPEAVVKVQEQSETQQKQIDVAKQVDKKPEKNLDQKHPQFEPTEEEKAKLQKAALAFISTLQSSKTTQRLVDVWTKIFEAGLNDEELKKLADSSKEDVKASQDAMLEFASEAQPFIKSALDKYLNGLKEAIEEHKKSAKK